MKLPNQTIKVYRNGYVFQIDPDNPFVRYKTWGFGGVSSIAFYKTTHTATADGRSSGTQAITAVASGKGSLRLIGFAANGDRSATDFSVGGYLLAVDTITFEVTNNGVSVSIDLFWEVTEYF